MDSFINLVAIGMGVLFPRYAVVFPLYVSEDCLSLFVVHDHLYNGALSLDGVTSVVQGKVDLCTSELDYKISRRLSVG